MKKYLPPWNVVGSVLTHMIFPAAVFLVMGCATTTPLMTAAEQGDVNTVKDLLDKGADVNETGDFHSTALRQAAEKGNIGVIKLLLDRGANVNAQDAGGETALLVAALKGHSDAVKLLIERGADINVKNYNGWTALAFASKADIAKMLLDKGADVNASNDSGATPLSSAAMADRKDVVKLFIEKGADLETALSRCEQTLESWSKSSNKYLRERSSQPRGCVALLKRIKNEKEEAKRQAQEIAKAEAIEAQKVKEMKEIVKEIVAESSRAQKQAVKFSAMSSVIGKPEIDVSRRLMGDSDLAVVIGIEGYQGLPKSEYSYDDAVLMKEYVKALGFRERNIEFLTDERATHSGIVKVVDAWLRNKAKPDSRVFVYYSGHGAPDPATGEAYIVPYDGDPNYLPETGYPLKRLYERLGSLPAKEVVVVLDACFSGSGGRSVLAKGARPLVMTAAAIPIAANMAVLTATQGAQISTSSSDKGHGIFTYYFLKALKDGKKNVAEIYEYLKPQVEDDAKAINVQQSPSLNPAPEKIAGKFQLLK